VDAPLPQPPMTAAEIEKENQLLEMMRALVPALKQRNLNNAVWLANQAARGEGPLVKHFAELEQYGFRWTRRAIKLLVKTKS
jgi:hypothetical protein